MEIEIDPARMQEAGKRLLKVSGEISDAQVRLDSTKLSASAFGLMNQAMVPQIHNLADKTSDLGKSTATLAYNIGTATTEVAETWSEFEERASEAITKLAAALDAIIPDSHSIEPTYSLYDADGGAQ